MASHVKTSFHLSGAQFAIIFLTLLGLLLGGATQLWEQSLILLAAGALMWFAPGRREVDFRLAVLAIALFVLSLAAFVPAFLPPTPSWRHHLTADLHLNLPFTRTPQPWLTLQGCLTLFAGLAWAYYLLSQRWTGDMRLGAARLLVFGVAVLAAVAIAAFALDFRVPNWNQEENRGWFPNRNQTADVLALCAVVNYALIFDCLRKKKKSLYLWLVTLAALDAALVISYSRAGILLFFGGIVLWHLWPWGDPKKKRGSKKWFAVGLSFIFILLTGFFLFGGNTLERFAGSSPDSSEDNHFRLAIQEDALRFSLQSPVLGVGLGNFEPLFASARQASVNSQRTIHPESDWLWMTCELGWLAPLLLAGAAVWWARRAFPFQNRSGESLRRGLIVAGVMFLLHGLVDVAGHRIGSLFVGLLVFSLALPGGSSRTEPTPPNPRIFRMLGGALALIGLWWLVASLGLPWPPTTANLDRAESGINAALAGGNMEEMERLSTAAIGLAPINWHFYFQRGYSETFQSGKLARATSDFMTARQLESKWVKPCFDEGLVWLQAGQPDLCMDAWTEALRRAPPGDAPDLFRDMSSRSHVNDLVHQDLMEYAVGQVPYQLIFLNDASSDEARQVIGDILTRDPELRRLSEEQREKLFYSWWTLGDRPELVTALVSHPDWLRAGWLFLAQSYADQQNFQGAWDIVAKCAPAPVVPQVTTTRSLEDLENDFADQSDSLAIGMLLYNAQMTHGNVENAIATLRMLEQIPNCPKYVFYLEAKSWATKQQWELAWTAWWNFHGTS